MKLLCTIFYLCLAPFLAPYYLYRIVIHKKYRESFSGVTGRSKPQRNPAPEGSRTFWLHAVSVGEVNVAAAMARKLKERFPEARLVVSTTTETGQAQARQTLGERVDEIFYYPLDLPWLVNSFLDRVRPTHFIMMETELWPIMLLTAAERGVRVFLLNGKLSPRSFRGYLSGRWFFKWPLAHVAAFCMQTPEDGARMKRLSGRPNAVHVTGNCKFDTPMEALSSEERTSMRAAWGLNDEQPVVVIGSTHAGEEELMLAAFTKVRAQLPDAAFILCPRHPERFDEVYELLVSRGLKVLRSSSTTQNRHDAKSSAPPEIVLLDQMGLLSRVYGIGDVAVVAGSFTPVGGHNLLEAAIHAVPVVYGPHMQNQPEIVRFFNEANAGVQVEGGKLGETLVDLLQDGERRCELGQRARQLVEMNKGSAQRNLDIIIASE